MHGRYPLRTFTANLQCVERTEHAGTEGDEAQKSMMIDNIWCTYVRVHCRMSSSLLFIPHQLRIQLLFLH